MTYLRKRRTSGLTTRGEVFSKVLLDRTLLLSKREYPLKSNTFEKKMILRNTFELSPSLSFLVYPGKVFGMEYGWSRTFSRTKEDTHHYPTTSLRPSNPSWWYAGTPGTKEHIDSLGLCPYTIIMYPIRFLTSRDRNE